VLETLVRGVWEQADKDTGMDADEKDEDAE